MVHAFCHQNWKYPSIPKRKSFKRRYGSSFYKMNIMFQFIKLNIMILHHYLLVFMLYVERSSWGSFKCQCTLWQTLILCVPLKCSSPNSFNWWRSTLISICIHLCIHLCHCHLCCSLPKTLDFLTFIFCYLFVLDAFKTLGNQFNNWKWINTQWINFNFLFS